MDKASARLRPETPRERAGRSVWRVGAQKQRHYVAHMFVCSGACQRRCATDQQAKMLATLDQAEEVFGGAAWVVDAQLAGLVGLFQQALHFIEQTLRAGLEKQLRQRGVLSGHGHHHPVQFDGFTTVDQPMKAMRNIAQHALDRRILWQLEQ